MRGRIGDVEAVRLADTELRAPITVIVSPEEVGGRPFEDLLDERYYDPATGMSAIALNVWLLRSAGKTILVDTGCGDLPRPGTEDLFEGFAPTRSPLLDRLAEQGVAPQDVDLVLITHSHADHVCGGTRRVDGRYEPTFPNASYVIARAEYEHAAAQAADPDLALFHQGVFRDYVEPLRAAGVLELVEDGHAIDDSITMRLIAGHTPGHMLVEVSSGGELAAVCGDLVHFPFEISEPDIGSEVADHDPAWAARTRRAVLDRFARDGTVLMTTHLHEGAGTVRREGEGFAFEPAWGT